MVYSNQRERKRKRERQRERETNLFRFPVACAKTHEHLFECNFFDANFILFLLLLLIIVGHKRIFHLFKNSSFILAVTSVNLAPFVSQTNKRAS